jgi:hypothetical protein
MSPGHAEVEESLTRSYRAFVADVPDDPPVAWSSFATTADGRTRHSHRIMGIAASVVLIVLATILWASPSAGAHYHGAEVVKVEPPGIAQLHGSQLCPCVAAV